MYCVFCIIYVFDLCLSVYNMCCPCMIATVPLATRKKNCFINVMEVLTIIWHCAFVVFFCALVLLFFSVDFYMLINHLLKKKSSIN